MRARAIKAAATLIGCVAVFSVATASFLWGNQPDVPEELLT
ncbi:cyclic lactone autoinducer peptide [Paenibacillus sp. IB182496]|uniref:Cyclic lactone autoinducer peptide n=1 Tax=Paenibacillus sabuli TaxID=2772509 RepID=A0A927BUF3_9BACL|nr:cyclic lactone autoinducer peptide [Paenibacillus sabuli]MBD2845719.1 cyclic lactone autoinducer peptide [Paenibacillus sabuli]